MQKTSYRNKVIALLVTLTVLVLPYFATPTVQAAIAVDSTSSATTGTNTAQTLTWSHTTIGTE